MRELRKVTAFVEMPQQVNPKWEFVFVHGLGEDVVYSVYDDADRKEIKVKDVDVGVDYLRFKFDNKPANIKIVVIG